MSKLEVGGIEIAVCQGRESAAGMWACRQRNSALPLPRIACRRRFAIGSRSRGRRGGSLP